MNTLTLIGTVVSTPVYHCTDRAQDIVRVRLMTRDRRGGEHVHHCLAYGPAALDLHAHLRVDEQLLVRGELLYRQRSINGTRHDVPYVLIRRYSYLGAGKPVPLTVTPRSQRTGAAAVI